MGSVIFGAGFWGKKFKRWLDHYYGVKVCAIVTNNKSKWGKKIDEVEILPPEKLAGMRFEKVFVCALSDASCNEMETQLIDMGIPREKIAMMRTSAEYLDVFRTERNFFRLNWMEAFSEYAEEIGLTGSVAECGVYRGYTAGFINLYWPDRTLHLFDTFEGFPEEDMAHDANAFAAFKNGEFAANPFKVDTPDSLIEEVKSKMPYLDKVVIHKGRFPECAGNIEEKFCFVNLDMDLYQPQLEGLRYFWNKMEAGGVILLHDYFRSDLPGVKAAVEAFEKETGDTLVKSPIGDYCSIAVFKR